MSESHAGFWPGALGHSSEHPNMRHDAYWLPALFRHPLGCGTYRTFSANIGFSVQCGPHWVPQGGNLSLSQGGAKHKTLGTCQADVGLCFHPGDATPGFALKIAKFQRLLSCFENALLKQKILSIYEQCKIIAEKWKQNIWQFPSQSICYPWIVSFSHCCGDNSQIHISNKKFPLKLCPELKLPIRHVQSFPRCFKLFFNVLWILFMAVLGL